MTWLEWVLTSGNVVPVVFWHLHGTQLRSRGAIGATGPIGPTGIESTVTCPICTTPLRIALEQAHFNEHRS